MVVETEIHRLNKNKSQSEYKIARIYQRKDLSGNSKIFYCVY
jgi:hypothetical protein